MPYRNRQSVSIENPHLRVTLLREGGHLAELHHKPSGINPLWTPPWPSIEPSTYSRTAHPEYGNDAESRLLAGIMGHNLCLDLFGGPSPEEHAAGIGVHGESSVVRYDVPAHSANSVTLTAHLPLAQLRVTRRLTLAPDSSLVGIDERVENLSACDRPLAWTQHATLGPPFVERGRTQLRSPATRSKVHEEDFAGRHGRLLPGAEFDWPNAPTKARGTLDLRTYSDAAASGGYTAQMMDPHREQAFAVAWSPTHRLLCGYVWRRADFPWLGIWEENRSRSAPPWSGATTTWGLEFGASPMPESRRKMVERGSLFGVPAFRWLPAKAVAEVSYCAFAQLAEAIPNEVRWDGAGLLTLA